MPLKFGVQMSGASCDHLNSISACVLSPKEKIKQNKVLPYLVANAVEIFDVDPEGEEDGANQDLDSMRKGKCAAIKTSTRETVFLTLIGLVPLH